MTVFKKDLHRSLMIKINAIKSGKLLTTGRKSRADHPICLVALLLAWVHSLVGGRELLCRRDRGAKKALSPHPTPHDHRRSKVLCRYGHLWHVPLPADWQSQGAHREKVCSQRVCMPALASR